MASFPLGQKFDGDGDPLAGGKAYFRLSGTTNPVQVYRDSLLSDALPYPIIGDAEGRFPTVVYFDPTLTLRYTLIGPAGDLSSPVESADPINVATSAASIGTDDLQTGSVTGAILHPDAVAESLGYTPANKAGETFTGPVELDYTLTSIADTAAGFRLVPTALKNADYTFVLDDAARGFAHSDATARAWSIPPDILPVGAMISTFNYGTGAVNLTRGAGVELVIGGTGTNANIAMAQWGNATLYQYALNRWVAWGVNLS